MFSKKSGQKAGRIYPDFISKNAENRIIADTKYKPVGNIGSKDYLQILAYMFRFDAKEGYYIYPEADTVVNSELTMYLNKGTTFDQNVSYQEDVVVTKLGLKIPKTNGLTYWQFSRQMRISERRLLDSIKNMHLSESK